MYYHFLFCHRKHRRRTAVKEQEMYPGSEFVAGGQKVKKGVQTRDIMSAVEVRSCYLDLFFAHPRTQLRSNLAHWNIWHVSFRCVFRAKYLLVWKSNRAMCKIWSSRVILPCLYIWLCVDSLTETISKHKDRLSFCQVHEAHISVISAPANIHKCDVGMTLKVQYVRIGSQTSPNK